MKRLLIFIVWIAMIFIANVACNDTQGKASAEVMKMPSFNLLKLDSSGVIRMDSIPNGRAIVLMYIDTECHSCQDEINSITSNAPLTKDWKVFLIGRESLQDLRAFEVKHNLNELEQIIVCKDPGLSLWNQFRLKSIPSTVVYDHTGKLKKRVDGSVTVYDIQDFIKHEEN